MKTLEMIKKYTDSKILLTSWTPPLMYKNEIERIINDGEEYIRRIDSVVKDCYIGETSDSLDCCRKTIEILRLPAFFVNPIVDKTFRSHLSQ
jgi:hypothetical protein